jgi:LuxR family transcriptional regulator, regulator of acetate metabolism
VVNDDAVDDVIDNLLPERLAQLQRSSGLPVVFGGAVRSTDEGQRLVLSTLSGTLGDSLAGLAVRPGAGLGGTVITRGVPCRVNDYASTAAITHDYDAMVVHDEKLTSIFAFPVKVRGDVRGVFYGAVRDTPPIGDSALRSAGVVAARLEKDLEIMLRPADQPDLQRPRRDMSLRSRTALNDLAMIIRTTDDPKLHERLVRIHRELGGEAPPPAPATTVAALAPRELEALRLVAVGASNVEIAAQLDLSPQTVKAYLRTAMRKLDVRNRTAAVHAARSAGML